MTQTITDLSAAIAALLASGYEVTFAAGETSAGEARPGLVDAYVMHNSDTVLGTGATAAVALASAWPQGVEMAAAACGAGAPPELAGYRCRLPLGHGGEEHEAAGCSWWVAPADAEPKNEAPPGAVAESPSRAPLINAMGADDRAVLLGYIAGRRPEAFAEALAAFPHIEARAGQLAGGRDCRECGHHAAEHSNIVSGECLAHGCGCARLSLAGGAR